MPWLGLGGRRGRSPQPREDLGAPAAALRISPPWSARPCPWPGWMRPSSTLTQAWFQRRVQWPRPRAGLQLVQCPSAPPLARL